MRFPPVNAQRESQSYLTQSFASISYMHAHTSIKRALKQGSTARACSLKTRTIASRPMAPTSLPGDCLPRSAAVSGSRSSRACGRGMLRSRLADSGGIGDRVQRGAPLPILPPLRSLLPVPEAAQTSMSAQIFFAQPTAILPSLSLRAADTPPAPGTGCTLLVAASYWYTAAIWMAFLASTKL